MGYKSGSKLTVAASLAKRTRLGLVLSFLVGTLAGLTAQQDQIEDVYLPDLGIVIEPGQLDSIVRTDSAYQLGNAGLLIGKEAPGADFIESTRELRSVLDDLSGKINALESSLDEDVEAVRLENERLRELIRKIQTDRIENEVALIAENHSEVIVSSPSEPAQARLPANPSYRQVLSAYWAGYFQDVITLSQALEDSVLSTDQETQLAYWCADAHYQQGQFDDALQSLEKIPLNEHELADDTIVLQGLIFLKQGRIQEARSRFQFIISSYPASEYQRLAELTIKELNQL